MTDSTASSVKNTLRKSRIDSESSSSVNIYSNWSLFNSGNQASNLDNKKQYTQNFTDYTSRDFNSIKQSLIQHIKSYFPQVYKDFNESSPGMMLVELSAYVGDVLNYYIDDSFKELMLPLSNDRRNVLNLSKLSGFKPRPIAPSYVDLKFTLEVDANTDDITGIIPDATQKLTLEAGTIVASNTQPDIVFETLHKYISKWRKWWRCYFYENYIFIWRI